MSESTLPSMSKNKVAEIERLMNEVIKKELGIEL